MFAGESYHLVVGKEYAVGRKEPCDIVFPTEMSLSRKHAVLRIEYQENHVVRIYLGPVYSKK